jgi:hypothetical protein
MEATVPTLEACVTSTLVRLAARVLRPARHPLLRVLVCAPVAAALPLDASAQYREAPRFRGTVEPPPVVALGELRAVDTTLVPLSDSALGIASRKKHMWYGVLVGYVAAGIHYSIDTERNGEMAASITNVVVMPSAILLGVVGGAAVHDIRVARARKKARVAPPSPPAPSPDVEPEDPANAQR